MTSEIHLEVTECLLSSISKQKGTGARASFFAKRPGDLLHHTGLGVEIYYNFTKLNIAALRVRSKGPAYLKFLPVSDITSMLQDFVVENYYILVEDTYLRISDGSYEKIVSSASKMKLSKALAESFVFKPIEKIIAFPLVPFRIKHDFHSDIFSLIKPESLTSLHIISRSVMHDLDPKNHPPIKAEVWEGRAEKPNAWLAILAPAKRVSLKMRSAILGALSLTLSQYSRYMFSKRHMFGGFCTFDNNGTISYSFGVPHTPGLMNDVILTKDDFGWLKIMPNLLKLQEKSDMRKINALEYFYRAWSLDKQERFPFHCMVLDALFGQAQQATQTIIDKLKLTLGVNIDDQRLRCLMKIRGDIIHGRAPDAYDSTAYEKYFSEYECDPIDDLEAVTSKALSSVIFGDTLRIRIDPQSGLISRAQASGDLPPKPPSILD